MKSKPGPNSPGLGKCADSPHSFLKLCKVKYYNFSPFHSVQKGFTCQTGDPLGPDSPESDGGSSIWGLLSGPSKQSFVADADLKLKHTERGTVSMATVPSTRDPDERLAGSQFIITLGDNIDYLDGKAPAPPSAARCLASASRMR